MGDGTGDGVGQCKKVTIAVFESGKILIIGATNIPQVDAAYEFIVRVLTSHFDRLTKNIATLV
jgi:TATA-box binding protein (TBP) (component of TFIID and TFIIIB)